MGISNGTRNPIAYIPSQASIDVYDILEGRKIGRLQGHYSVVNECHVHPFRQEMYTAAADTEILVWNPPDHERYDTEGASQPEQEDAWTSDEEDAF